MVIQAVPPILTIAGRYAVPYLIREFAKKGSEKFSTTYGTAALESINSIGAQNPELFNEEFERYTNDVDEGKEEETTGTELSTEVKEKPPELPEEPPKGPDIGTELATEAAVQTTKKLLEDKKPDVSKQTKELVPEKPEFGELTETEIQTAKALKEGKPDFYSRVVKSIKDAKPNKLTKNKWKSFIQADKNEIKYLGLDKYLQGNESITKEELLKFVEKKDITPNITVRSIPKDEMNPMYEGYSLGGYTAEDTQEYIVFQIGKDSGGKDWSDAEVVQLFKSEHVDTEYGTGNFAHARTQVGYEPSTFAEINLEKGMYEEIKKAFNNTLIIDEIQSDWLQKGQDEGFITDYDIVPGDKLVDYFKKHNITYRYEEKPPAWVKREVEDFEGYRRIEFTQADSIEPGDAPAIGEMDPDVKYIFRKSDNTEFTRWQPEKYEEDARYSTVEEFLQKAYGKVPDFPIKESKKWVELVLNKMIEKAVLDGRDSIAITNGEIQANRYEAMGKKEKQGLKKFYNEIVFKQLEKISDKYNVELERINITEGEAPKELQDIHLANQIKRAQDDGYVLQKVSLQFLWDRIKDTNIPGHAALYSDAGVGQGRDYITSYLSQYQIEEDTDEAWNKIRNNEVYIWKKTIPSQHLSGTPATTISWDLPIVPVKDAVNYAKDLPDEERGDLGTYHKYIKDAKPHKGEEIGPEQLIKMKLPKKLQKERLSTPIKLSKAKKQTDKLFA